MRELAHIVTQNHRRPAPAAARNGPSAVLDIRCEYVLAELADVIVGHPIVLDGYLSPAVSESLFPRVRGVVALPRWTTADADQLLRATTNLDGADAGYVDVDVAEKTGTSSGPLDDLIDQFTELMMNGYLGR